MGGSNQMDGWIGSERVWVKGTIGWLPNSSFNISANWIYTVLKKYPIQI